MTYPILPAGTVVKPTISIGRFQWMEDPLGSRAGARPYSPRHVAGTAGQSHHGASGSGATSVGQDVEIRQRPLNCTHMRGQLNP